MTLALLLAALLQWTSSTLAERTPAVLMAGTWQSCPEGDDYTERALDFTIHDRPWFSVHLGPRDQFALFAGATTDEHIAHTDARNLLGPAFHYDDLRRRTGRHWSAASVGVHVSVAQIPGSFEDCYYYVVKIERDAPPTWAKEH